MKRIFNILIISILLVSCAVKQPKSNYNQKELVILSVNDMHGKIENMPRFAFVADSLRSIYPELIIVSAGDNRTGNPYNDKFPGHPNFPMINIMNEIGFDVSALGNHEFDGNIDGIRYFVNTTKFPVICANTYFTGYPDLKLPDYVTITRRIDGKDVKTIFLGMIETENDGKPSSHEKNMKNVDFKPAESVIGDYLYLQDSCDVFVLLSHCGKDEETKFAMEFPEFDMIIGGHSHDLYTHQFDDGVLYTQSKSYITYATVSKIRFKDGDIVSVEAQPIDLSKVTKVDAEIQKEVDGYYANPDFHVVLGTAKTQFDGWDALGAFMADAVRYITKADIGMQNPGGVRLDSLHGGNIDKADIFALDPFDNELVIAKMTGKQIEDYLDVASTADGDCTHVSGITYTIDMIKSDKGQMSFNNAKVYLENGEPIDPEGVYTVALNSYMAKWAQGHSISIEETDFTANDGEILYLKDHQSVDYKGISRYTVTKK
ncbi:MAG: 5'-nucleotidase C-terminal domain-containing protein [Bacteroidales bacterium]|nr:5'-nucleotidase C-terminal domain-containing protein [Bacteroidales bacterium]